VVDVTNYVLWELGHPLHAFDRELVGKHHVVVRRARPGERLTTLDGQVRALTPEMLVIADPERAIGIAGVMGGANTEVGEATTSVLLESAYFQPGSVRRTARALGLSTEASYRFERGADVEGLRLALDRAAGMIAELAAGRVARGVLDAYPAPPPPRRVTLRPSRIRQVVGAAPPPEAIAAILAGLGLPAEPREEAFEVAVPSFRRDVTMEDDLVEEVVRVWGYDHIPSTLPSGALTLTRRPRSLRVLDAVRAALTAAGLQEAVTLSLVDPAALARLGYGPGDPRLVPVQNPLARDRSVLRPTLLAGLLEVLAANVRRQAPDVRLFEVGRVFASRGAGELPHEDTRAAIALTGLRAPRSWFAGRARADVFDAKGAVEGLVEALGRGEVSVEPVAAAHLEEGRGGTVLVGGTPVGTFGELAPAVQQALDLPGPVYVAEVSLDGLEALPARVRQHRPLPRHPGVQRDLAVVLPAGVPAARVQAAIEAAAPATLRRVVLFDVYAGDPVPPGMRSLAFGLFYRTDERTLTDAEVNQAHAAVVEHVRAELGAEVRGDARGAGA
jgi:phenylalanyl-tRNA synthetase beta chain